MRYFFAECCRSSSIHPRPGIAAFSGDETLCIQMEKGSIYSSWAVLESQSVYSPAWYSQGNEQPQGCTVSPLLCEMKERNEREGARSVFENSETLKLGHGCTLSNSTFSFYLENDVLVLGPHSALFSALVSSMEIAASWIG